MKTAQFILLAFLTVAVPAHGQAYKCRQPDGSTQISSEPCAGGARTLKEVNEDVIPDDVRAKAQRDVDRQRQRADQFKAERKADEAQQRREAEAERRAGGLPSPAAVQQCLNTVGRMNIDSSRRAELESECTLTGQVAPVYNETYQQPYYNHGGGYHRPYPPRPVPPIAPVLPPAKPGKPVDLYKVPATPRNR
ncbi:MAG: hypothetical protein WAS49_05820 [Candidatus Dechloromonas phosphoritropha]|jgi:hypothetical protein|nr:hypothetical protein [Candidatus Dechloromonas phosphoritropha]MBP8786277.1 hypothetical protein [Azonexus sp.]MBP9227215.1 hypothetical protein [Azonexus sp.]